MPTADATDRPRRPLEGLRRWAARDPDRVALRDAELSMTYGELLAYVEATAPAARAALGQRTDGAFLPVLVDRSVGSAAAVLACLLGRVRFVPVDAAAAPELVQSIVGRAGAPGVHLAGPRVSPGVAGSVPIDLGRAVGAGDTVDEPAESETGLLFFSSGSTGEPKGIVLTWHALEQRWRSRDREYAAFGDDRRQPLVIPLDSSWGVAKVGDVASGFGEHIIDVASTGPVAFLAESRRFGATAMAIPAQLARLIAQLPPRLVIPLPAVRRLHIAAEGFRYEYMPGLQATFGPTTTIVHSLASSEGGREIATCFALQDAPAAGAVHIGEPLFPDSLRVVDVPGMDGVGEVHVAGSIAVGYLDDPELTQNRFYIDADGRRWWRSHDLVSRDPVGGLRHEGRLDDVVKVRGKLAAPGDVTAVLLDIGGITSAITVPVVTDGNTRLVAHVDVAPGSALTLAEVRQVLSSRLPAHAVPSAVMRHARLPVTGRGKVDRSALMAGPFESW